jgi:hypothetical protein
MSAQITDQQAQQVSSRSWTTRRDEKQRRLRLVSSWMKGPLLPRDKLVESLLSEDQRDRLVQIAERCPIHRMLVPQVQIQTTRNDTAAHPP